MTIISNCHMAEVFGVDYCPEFISRLILYMDDTFTEDNTEKKEGFDNLVRKILNHYTASYNDSLHLVLGAHGWNGYTFFSQGSTFSGPVLKNVLTMLYYSQVWKMDRLKSRRDMTHASPRGVFHDDDNLALAFVPTVLHSLVIQNLKSDGSFPEGPQSISFTGACLLADISGFTKMSAKFCDQGLRGLDDLHRNTSGILGQYVQIVYAHGGDGK